MRKTSILLFILLGWLQTYSQSVVNLDGHQKLPLGDQFGMLDLTNNPQQADEIVEGKLKVEFKPFDKKIINQRTGRFLLSLDVLNSTSKTQIYFIGTSKFDFIKFYIPDSSGRYVVSVSGIMKNFAEKSIVNGPFSLVRLSVPSNNKVRCFLEVENSKPPAFQFVNLNPTIFTESQYYFEYGNTWIYNLIFLGICLVMFLYNSMLFIITRERAYLIYLGYIAFILGYVYALSGDLIAHLFKNAIYQNDLVMVTGIGALLFYAAFAIRILDLKIFYPRWRKFFQLVVILQAIAFLLTITGFIYIAIPICFTLALITYPGILILAFLIGFRKKYLPGRYFFAAATFYIAFLQLSFLQMLGLLPVSIFGLQANNFTQIGVTGELILFSIALAAKLNQMRKEKFEAQKKTLEIAEENERLIREQNVVLEEKVAKRTQELEATLTALKSTQNQLVLNEKMASLGQLVAGIAHEINNPINFVSSNIKPLKRDFADILKVFRRYKELDVAMLNPEIQKMIVELDLEYAFKEIGELLEGIEDGAERTTEIVRSLRNFSRTDEAELKKADLNEGINSTLLILQSKLKSKAIEVEKEFNKIPSIQCYPGQLNQVFLNLISNSIDAINHDHGRIKINTEISGDSAVIHISDNGDGISPEKITKIFEPFYTTKDVGKGTGLGLSISYGIIEKHQGTITVKSQPGIETTFTIIIPIR